jgi:large subunit ribosomal protein L4
MIEVKVVDREGKEKGQARLDDFYFAAPVNVPVMHLAVRRQLAAARSGSASTKERSQVRGGGAKPWRQKGTGRARAGSIRSPLWKGGGTVFGPHPRDYEIKVNKKMRRLALRSSLSVRAGEGRIVVVEDFTMPQPRTRDILGMFDALELDGNVLLVLPDIDVNIIKSTRNLPGALAVVVDELNTYDVLTSDWLVFTRSALDKLQGGGEDERPA